MSASDALILLLQSGFVLLAALVVGFFTRRVPAVRQGVYRVALVAAVLLAIGQPWLRERPAPVVPVRWSVPVTTVRSTPVKSTPVVGIPHESPVVSVQDADTPSPLLSDPLQFLPTVWFLGVILLSAHLAAGYLVLANVRRGCRPVTDGETWRVLGIVSRNAGIPVPLVVEGESVGNPFVAGVWRPTIYLPLDWSLQPESFASRSAVPAAALPSFSESSTKVDATPEGRGVLMLEAVLRHEVAHVANRDLAWNLLHRVLCIAFWPQLFLWLLRKPLNDAAEELCDGHVLAAGVPGARYAECLLNLRESLRAKPCPSLGIGAISSRSALGKRVEAILDAKRSRMIRLSKTLTLALRVGTLGLGAAAALVFARPTGTQEPRENWIMTPYAGNVQVLGAEGKRVTPNAAWILLTNDKGAVRFEPAKVSSGSVVLPGKADGRFNQGKLVVRADGYGLGFARIWPAPKPMTSITLGAATAAEGKLLLPNGQPAAGLPVKIGMFVMMNRSPQPAEFLQTKELPDAMLRTTTKADGTFRFEGLPAKADVAYSVQDDRFAELRMGDRLHTGDSGVAKGKPTTLQFGAALLGRVLRDGKPVANVHIGAQSNMSDGGAVDGWGSAITDKDGRYTMKSLPAGIYNVIADLNNEGDTGVTAVAFEGISVKAGSTRGGLDFDLIPGVVIHGHVTDESGKPVKGASVGVYGPAHPQSSAWVQDSLTAADGSYLLRVPAGKQYVYIADSRYSSKAQTLSVRDGLQVTVDFKVGRIADDSGELVPASAKAAEEVSEPITKALDTRTEGPVGSFGPGQPAYGPFKLKSGATVRLAYVQDDRSGPHTLWKPDGSPADPKDVAASLNMTGFDSRKSATRTLHLRVEVEGATRGDYYCLVEVPHRSGYTVWQSYGDSENRTMDLAAFEAPAKLRATDMRFGVAAGPYRDVLGGKIGEGPLFARADSGQPSAPATLVGDAGVAITVRIPRGLEGQDVRLEAFDKSGRKMDLASWQNEDMKEKATGQPVRTYGFSGGAAADVARVELVAREYEWATFKGIQTHPKARP